MIRDESLPEVAALLGVPIEQLLAADAARHARSTASIDAPSPEGDEPGGAALGAGRLARLRTVASAATSPARTAVVAAASDVVFQGHLAPGPEYVRLTEALLRHAGPHLKHAWLSVSGAMANENALKMIFQKHAPADRVIAQVGGGGGEDHRPPVGGGCGKGGVGGLVGKAAARACREQPDRRYGSLPEFHAAWTAARGAAGPARPRLAT